MENPQYLRIVPSIVQLYKVFICKDKNLFKLP